MPAAHVAGLPLEEMLPALAAPLAVYVAALAVTLRGARRRARKLTRRGLRSG